MWDFCLCCAIVVLDSLYQPVPVSVAWSVVVFSHACGLELALSFSPGRWFGMGAQEVSEECRLASFILLKLGRAVWCVRVTCFWILALHLRVGLALPGLAFWDAVLHGIVGMLRVCEQVSLLSCLRARLSVVRAILSGVLFWRGLAVSCGCALALWFSV